METKPYLVIARKYRPQTFEDMVGQEHVTKTLSNALTLNRVAHAYLFTGPRGVGKTSMARIFAKALNCVKGPTPEPCGKCQPCLEIEGVRSLDVLEIDGASNRGIDEIRALRENVKFAPAFSKYKIYIIDEVHQITNDGFNALLKTLEEPPPHVKFIFATTAANKVPATILSRCQRYDFKRIPTQLIADTLKEICKNEKIKADNDALFLIAKFADGGLRDSQSILDQVASSSEGKVTAENVLKSLGALEDEEFLELTSAIAKKDAKSAVLVLNRSLDKGKDPHLFLEKLLEHIRNLLFMHASEDLASLIEATENYKKALAEQKSLFTKEELFYFFSVVTQTLQVMRRFELKRIPIEIALIKLANRVPMENIVELLDKLKNTEKKTLIPERRKEIFVSKAPEAPIKEPTARAEVEEVLNEADVEELPEGDIEIPSAIEEKKISSLDTIWQPLLKALKGDKISVASYLAEGEPIGFANGIASIAFPEKMTFHRETLEMDVNRRLIEQHLASLLDQPVRVEFRSVKAVAGKGPAKVDFTDEIISQNPESAEALKSAMNLFGGKIVGR